MERFVKGDVVVVHFPFSDLSQAKKRPALVVSAPKGNDLILCQISTKQTKDSYAIPLPPTDFVSGTIRQESIIRPNKLFTFDKSIILYKAGAISRQKIENTIEKVCEIIRE